MNRLQIIVATGLFLIVALFGWQSYLEKSSHKNRSESRGLPIQFLNDVKRFEASKTVPDTPAIPKKAQVEKTDDTVPPTP